MSVMEIQEVTHAGRFKSKNFLNLYLDQCFADNDWYGPIETALVKLVKRFVDGFEDEPPSWNWVQRPSVALEKLEFDYLLAGYLSRGDLSCSKICGCFGLLILFMQEKHWIDLDVIYDWAEELKQKFDDWVKEQGGWDSIVSYAFIVTEDNP